MLRIRFKSFLLAVIPASFFFLVSAQGCAPSPFAPADQAELAQETVAPEAVPPVRKGILVLFPFQAELPHHQMASRAIQEEFGAATDLSFDLYIEYMDMNRFSDETDQQQFFDRCASRYGNRQIDLVMISNNVLLNHWLAHRDEILPDTPVVFFGNVSRDLDASQLPSDVTGINTIVDYTNSLNWILQARRSVKEIVLVRGTGVLAQEGSPAIEDVKQAALGRVQLTDASDLPMAEIKQMVASLPQTSVVLYTLMDKDAAGVQYRPIDALRELAQVSSVPVLSGFDQFIGTGTVGGYIYSVEHQAHEAARIGLRILRGEAAGDIPITKNRSDGFVFDHAALQRYGIPLSALPPESVIKNRQYTAWDLYRPQIIVAIAAFLGMALLVVLLTGSNRQLRTARRTLSEFNVGLETQVQERTAALSHTNRQLEAEIAERVQAETEREHVIVELQNALVKVEQLEGILPICSFCKKIRDENDEWQSVETFITDHSQALFSHGFCPECGRKYYPDFFPEPTDDE